MVKSEKGSSGFLSSRSKAVGKNFKKAAMKIDFQAAVVLISKRSRSSGFPFTASKTLDCIDFNFRVLDGIVAIRCEEDVAVQSLTSGKLITT